MPNRPAPPAGVTDNWIWNGTEQVSLTDDKRTLTIQRVAGSKKGTSTFLVAQISGVQVERPRFGQVLGRFRVVVPGAVAPRRSQSAMDDAADPFVVLFNKKLLPNFESFARSVQAARSAAHQVQAAPAGVGGDLAAQLAGLAEMHRTGVLTDAEFAAAKARLLGGQFES